MNAPAPKVDAPAAPAAPTVSTPTTPTAPTAPTTTDPKPSANEFDNLGSADDLDTVEITPDPAAAPTVKEGATSTPEAPGEPPKEPPAATASPQPEPVKEPPKEPKKDGAAAPAPSPAPAAAEDNSPQGLVNQLVQHRESVLDALAGDRFKLSEAEVKALDTDAVGAIPRVMARVYYESMQSTLLHIQNLVPQMVMSVLRSQKANDEVENSFYSKFSALDRSKHASDVAQFAQLMRQSNPKITQDDLFAMVGAAVMAKHGLSGAPAAANGGAPPRPAQPAPFVPAQPGASVKIVPEPESPFAGLGKVFDE